MDNKNTAMKGVERKQQFSRRKPDSIKIHRKNQEKNAKSVEYLTSGDEHISTLVSFLKNSDRQAIEEE